MIIVYRFRGIHFEHNPAYWTGRSGETREHDGEAASDHDGHPGGDTAGAGVVYVSVCGGVFVHVGGSEGMHELSYYE